GRGQDVPPSSSSPSPGDKALLPSDKDKPLRHVHCKRACFASYSHRRRAESVCRLNVFCCYCCYCLVGSIAFHHRGPFISTLHNLQGHFLGSHSQKCSKIGLQVQEVDSTVL
uniref:Uncharacterized protein n=1 Tax=Neogobius melanostomus TaxID=47308 RepID=A0A8C6WEZ9_9GOBI